MGSLVTYPSFGEPSRLGTTYSWDGIPMPANEFFQTVGALMHGRFGLLESSARASAPRFIGYTVSTYNGRLNRYFGSNLEAAKREAIEQDHYTVDRNWLVSDGWGFDVSSLPQNTQVSENLRNFSTAVAAASQILSGDNECSRFFKGAGVGALNAIADAVNSGGDSAFQAFVNDSSTGIRMRIPSVVNSQDAPIVSSDLYAAVSPTSVRINTNGPFVLSAAAGNVTLPRFGGYSPGSLESRVLQLLHEAGHLKITDVRTTLRGIRVGNQMRFYPQRRLTHLLPIDAGNSPLSEENTARILAACRDQINALRNRR